MKPAAISLPCLGRVAAAIGAELKSRISRIIGKPMMNLTKANIQAYAARYDQKISARDNFVERTMKQTLTNQRFLTKRQLVRIGDWKSRRPKKHYRNNDQGAVEELTAFSFSAKTELARVGSLLALNGVSFPVASAMLHFAFPDRYPILDFRVLWSLGWKQPKSYTFKFWNRYCSRIRRIAQRFNLPIRTAEKALWQYSRDHQS